MSYSTILLTKEAGIATITLNRPERLNALTIKMYEELVQATAEVAKDDAVRVLVITGAGKAFAAGADQSGEQGEASEHDIGFLFKGIRELGNRTILNIRNMEKPAIAAVNGPAVGWGCSLVLACDMIIASEKAKFGSVFVNIGLHPDGGAAYFLPRLVGIPRACELIFTGRIFDAQEADKMGLVTKVVPADQLESAVKELASKIANGPSLAIGLSKLTIYQGLMMDLPAVLEAEARAQLACIFSDDNKEGVKAFREKRKPQFKGR